MSTIRRRLYLLSGWSSWSKKWITTDSWKAVRCIFREKKGVMCENYFWTVTRSGSLRHHEGGHRLWIAPDEYVARIEEIDAKIEALKRERRDLVLEAADRARPCRYEDVPEPDKRTSSSVKSQ